jgi:hypothetical protein
MYQHTIPRRANTETKQTKNKNNSLYFDFIMTILTKKCFTLLGWLATGMIVTPAMSMHVRKGVPLFCFVLSVVLFLILFDLVWFPLVWL